MTEGIFPEGMVISGRGAESLLQTLGSLFGDNKDRHWEDSAIDLNAEPDPQRFTQAFTLMQQLDARLFTVFATESDDSGTFIPQLVITDHEAIKVLAFALGETGPKDIAEWKRDVMRFGFGCEDFSYEDLTQGQDIIVRHAKVTARIKWLDEQWHEEHGEDASSAVFRESAEDAGETHEWADVVRESVNPESIGAGWPEEQID